MLLFIAIVLLVLTLVGFILESNFITDGLGLFVSVICGTILILLLLVWPIKYTMELSNIQTYYSIKATIEVQRENAISPMEQVGLTHSIIEINSWIANVQYWNGTIFNQAIPDEVMELEPIE